MSKPWFLKMAMEAEPSPLAGVIANVLQGASLTQKSVNLSDKSSITSGLVNGVTTLQL